MFTFKETSINHKRVLYYYFIPELSAEQAKYALGEYRSRIFIVFDTNTSMDIIASKSEYESFKLDFDAYKEY